MSLSLFGEHEFLGDVASNKGWSDMLAAFEGTDDRTIDFFLSNGYTERPAMLADHFDEALPSIKAASVVETVHNLAKLLRKARHIAIVSDGVGSEPDTKYLDERVGTKLTGYQPAKDGPFPKPCATCGSYSEPGRCDKTQVLADPEVRWFNEERTHKAVEAGGRCRYWWKAQN